MMNICSFVLMAGSREVEWNFLSEGVVGGEGKEGAGNSELETEWVGFLKKCTFFVVLLKNGKTNILTLCTSLILWENCQKWV